MSNLASGITWDRVLCAVVLPTIAFIPGAFFVMDSVNGKGDTLGFRALGLTMLMPVLIAVVAICNLILLRRIPLLPRGVQFLIGLVVPTIMSILMLVYLWHGYWDGRPN